MAEKSQHSVELYDEDIRFLEEMAKRYSLPDVGKAIRCLINHAREKENEQSQIFDEIRCQNC